jgi:hypothetical protein
MEEFFNIFRCEAAMEAERERERELSSDENARQKRKQVAAV